MPPRRAIKRPLSNSESLTNPTLKKKVKRVSSVLNIQRPSIPGIILALGQGDMGQLGLGEDITERRRPSKIPALENLDIVAAAAGGMHTLCLTSSGTVYSFGCNDEGSLGRDTSVEGSEFTPGAVELMEKIKQVSVGDSHSAALGHNGRVYVWGTFRDSTGQLGLMEENRKETRPVELTEVGSVVKIASGDDHLVCLSERGYVYTMGNAEQGQLGRLSKHFCQRRSRRGAEPFLQLKPLRFHIQRRYGRFKNIWAGSFSSFAQEKHTGHVYAWGLNNYCQLGFVSDNRDEPEFRPKLVKDMVDIRDMSSGQHHTLALTNNGEVISFGNHHYGRTGQPDAKDIVQPTVIPSLPQTCVAISAGNCVSYAVSGDGVAYSFGFGTNLQLSSSADDPEDDVWIPARMVGKQLENKTCVSICGGGQHALLLVRNKLVNEDVGDN